MTRTTNLSQDFYCSQKFWWLSVDLEKFQTFSCCAATPQQVNMSWLKQNIGQLFNTPELHNDRRLMIENQPTSSCASTCWRPEAQGMPSRRTISNSQKQTHLSIDSTPEVLNIVVGTDCNLTCVYCCKTYSTAWTRDIIKNTYPVDGTDDRFTINTTDQILQFVSQKELATSHKRQELTAAVVELYQSPTLKEIMITGGEPFLYLDLDQLVSNIPTNIPVQIWSGLGVDEKRFAKEIKKLPNNVTVVVSAENIGAAYEFVRHGNTWERFNNNITQLKQAGVPYMFSCTVTNLTVLGLRDFILWAKDTPIRFQPCTDPDYLAIGVLDMQTKKLIQNDLLDLPEFVVQSLKVDPTEKQVYNLKSYIKEFANRRGLSFDVFPTTFAHWLDQ